MPPFRTLGREYVLTLACQDGPGLVFEVAGFLLRFGANISSSRQLDDPTTGCFFMRVQFAFVGDVPPVDELRSAFDGVARRNGMTFELVDTATPTRTLILASRLGHCLGDLLHRYRIGTLNIEVPVIVSNHPDHATLAASYGIEYRHLPVSPDTAAAAEEELLGLVAAHDIDLVVLARYLRVLSAPTSRALAGRAIGIHPFVPGVAGTRPYSLAHARGARLIGATAHYVNDELDAGPIIEQDVARVDPDSAPDHLVAAGHEVEARVLARAVQWHTERRIVATGGRTVVLR